MIEWESVAVCFAKGKQWLFCGGESEFLLSNKELDHTASLGWVLAGDDFQLNTLQIGDYIEKSELDSEQKHNDVVGVFELFGFEKGYGKNSFKHFIIEGFNVLYGSKKEILTATHVDNPNIKRKLTYNQIMAIGKLKRMINEREEVKAATELSADNDQVKNPNHYQLMDGVESIEIIARSMTQEQFKGYCLGNTLKYRLRAGKKDALQQDIDKANFYGELYEMHKDKCYS